MEISQKSHPETDAIPHELQIPLTFIELLQLQDFETVVLGQKKMCYCKRDSLVVLPGQPSLWVITKLRG